MDAVLNIDKMSRMELRQMIVDLVDKSCKVCEHQNIDIMDYPCNDCTVKNPKYWKAKTEIKEYLGW